MVEPSAQAIDRAKVWSIGLLHMGQSFPGALAAVALPALFRQNGLPLEMFWIFALPLIPGWLRWAIALLVDNHGSVRFGFRKSWIVPCTLAGAGFYLVLAQISPTPDHLWLIVGLLCCKSVIMTAQDVAVDGTVVESLTLRERPLGAAIVVYLMFIGTVAAQGFVAGVEHFGWGAMLNGAALLLVLVALPWVLRRELPPPDMAQRRRNAGQSASLLKLLRQRQTPPILLVLACIGLTSNLMRAMLPVYLVDLGLGLGEIGIVFGSAVVIGASLAAVTTARCIRWFGLRAMVLWVILGYLPCALGFVWFEQGTPSLLQVGAVMTLVMYVSTVMWMLVMNARLAWSSKVQAATDFSAQASVANFGEWVGASIAGLVASSIGWSWFFNLSWVGVALAAVGFYFLIAYVERNPHLFCPD